MQFTILFSQLSDTSSRLRFAQNGEKELIDKGYANGDLALPHFSGIAIIVDDEIASIATFYRNNTGDLWIPLFYTAPKFRGRGFCKKIMESLVEHNNGSAIQWGANVSNKGAIRLYDSVAQKSFHLYRYPR